MAFLSLKLLKQLVYVEAENKFLVTFG